MVSTGRSSLSLVLLITGSRLFLAEPWSQSQSAVGSEPSTMEALARQQNVQTRWANEIARWESDGTRLVLTALVLKEDVPTAPTVRGVKIELSNGIVTDEIYLDDQATERTRLALQKISETVARTGFLRNGCIGAAEFWPLYNWPWNKYHELNADFCNFSGRPELVLHGRGKPESFKFPDKDPVSLGTVLAAAMEQLKQH